MNEVGVEELEAQHDHYMHYTQVPVVHYAISKKLEGLQSYNELVSFVKDHLEQRLISPEPCSFTDDITESAKSLTKAFEQLIEAYKNKRDTEVAKAFR